MKELTISMFTVLLFNFANAQEWKLSGGNILSKGTKVASITEESKDVFIISDVNNIPRLKMGADLRTYFLDDNKSFVINLSVDQWTINTKKAIAKNIVKYDSLFTPSGYKPEHKLGFIKQFTGVCYDNDQIISNTKRDKNAKIICYGYKNHGTLTQSSYITQDNFIIGYVDFAEHKQKDRLKWAVFAVKNIKQEVVGSISNFGSKTSKDNAGNQLITYDMTWYNKDNTQKGDYKWGPNALLIEDRLYEKGCTELNKLGAFDF